MTSPESIHDTTGQQDGADDQFANLVEFVHGWLIPIYRRRVGDGRHRTWCPKWWLHPEAVVRLTALWRSFEEAHHSGAPSDMSVWLRDHLDMHMPQLTAPDGPLKGCSVDTGHSDNPLEPWPVDKPPAVLRDNTSADHYQADNEHVGQVLPLHTQ